MEVAFDVSMHVWIERQRERERAKKKIKVYRNTGENVIARERKLSLDLGVPHESTP